MKRHHTMGGVIINKDAQVIDRRGNIVPGLYAAGEVTGGIHVPTVSAVTLWLTSSHTVVSPV